MSKTKKERTVEIQKSLETRARFPISYFDSRRYIQHNVGIEDGLGPILAFMDSLPANHTKVEVCRAFEDGDFSVAHANYELGDWGNLVGFEVHRWQDDRIVEHWDNLQATPGTVNPSQRTMTDGATEVKDLERTSTNKLLVGRFTNAVLIGRDFEQASTYFKDNELAQHSPLYGDGLSSLLQALGGATRDGSKPEYIRLHKLLGEGNMVLTLSEGTIGEHDGKRQSAAFYDLYRVHNGAIAEHWDVTQIIPPRETWQNSNGKF